MIAGKFEVARMTAETMMVTYLLVGGLGLLCLAHATRGGAP